MIVDIWYLAAKSVFPSKDRGPPPFQNQPVSFQLNILFRYTLNVASSNDTLKSIGYHTSFVSITLRKWQISSILQWSKWHTCESDSYNLKTRRQISVKNCMNILYNLLYHKMEKE